MNMTTVLGENVSMAIAFKKGYALMRRIYIESESKWCYDCLLDRPDLMTKQNVVILYEAIKSEKTEVQLDTGQTAYLV